MPVSDSKTEISAQDYSAFDTTVIATLVTQATWFTDITGKTIQDTNLSQAGQMPGQSKLRIQAVRFVIHPINVAALLTPRDVWEVMQGYFGIFTGGDHLEFEGHIYDAPAGSGIAYGYDAAATTGQHQNGFPAVSNRRFLKTPIELKGGDAIKVVAQWSRAAIVLATSARVCCYLEGIRGRPVKG